MPRLEFDPTASLMALDGRSTLHPIRAETAGLTGWIQAEMVAESREVNVAAGRIEIPLSELSSGNGLYDAELRRRIDVRRFPVATGELSDWQSTDRLGVYRVRGDVCFRGVTCSVENDVTLSFEDDRTVMIDGSWAFDIREFGMEPPRLLSLRVFPEVAIRVAVVGRRAD